jgi:hypothetical protein
MEPLMRRMVVVLALLLGSTHAISQGDGSWRVIVEAPRAPVFVAVCEAQGPANRDGWHVQLVGARLAFLLRHESFGLPPRFIESVMMVTAGSERFPVQIERTFANSFSLRGPTPNRLIDAVRNNDELTFDVPMFGPQVISVRNSGPVLAQLSRC